MAHLIWNKIIINWISSQYRIRQLLTRRFIPWHDTVKIKHHIPLRVIMEEVIHTFMFLDPMIDSMFHAYFYGIRFAMPTFSNNSTTHKLPPFNNSNSMGAVSKHWAKQYSSFTHHFQKLKHAVVRWLVLNIDDFVNFDRSFAQGETTAIAATFKEYSWGVLPSFCKNWQSDHAKALFHGRL